jgi:hypothetical protein
MSGADGTHSICVCTFDQNVKLLLGACKISELTRSSDHIFLHTNAINCDLRFVSDKLFFP